ncbi:MAG: hypothetical protein WC997_16925 [Porticoccaceae bacterium]
MEDDRKQSRGERPANDNHLPIDRDAAGKIESFERLDAVVLSIARLIGRRMAREDFGKAMQAANDNAPNSADEPDADL